MEIIGDEMVDPDFGTGIVKLTPAHDFADFEAAQRHGLPLVRAIDETGKDIRTGMRVKMARLKTVEELREKGAIERVDENYKHVIGVCYRCKM